MLEPRNKQRKQGSLGNIDNNTTANLSGLPNTGNAVTNARLVEYQAAKSDALPADPQTGESFRDLTPKQRIGAGVASLVNVAKGVGDLYTGAAQGVSSSAKKVGEWYEGVPITQSTTGNVTQPVSQQTVTQPANTVTAPKDSSLVANVQAGSSVDTNYEQPAYQTLQQSSQPYQRVAGRLGENVSTLTFSNAKTGGTGSIQFSDGRTLSPDQMKSLQERLNYQNTDKAESNRIRDAQVVADRNREYEAYLAKQGLRDSLSDIPMTRFNQTLKMQKEENDLEAARVTALGKVQEAKVKEAPLAAFRQAETDLKNRQQGMAEANAGLNAYRNIYEKTGMPPSLGMATNLIMNSPGRDLNTVKENLAGILGQEGDYSTLAKAYQEGDEAAKSEWYRSKGLPNTAVGLYDQIMREKFNY